MQSTCQGSIAPRPIHSTRRTLFIGRQRRAGFGQTQLPNANLRLPAEPPLPCAELIATHSSPHEPPLRLADCGSPGSQHGRRCKRTGEPVGHASTLPVAQRVGLREFSAAEAHHVGHLRSGVTERCAERALRSCHSRTRRTQSGCRRRHEPPPIRASRARPRHPARYRRQQVCSRFLQMHTDRDK